MKFDFEELAGKLQEYTDARDYLATLEAIRGETDEARKRILQRRLSNLERNVRALFIAKYDDDLRFWVIVFSASLRDAVAKLPADRDVLVVAHHGHVLLNGNEVEMAWRLMAGNAVVRRADLEALVEQGGAMVGMRFDRGCWFGTGTLEQSIRVAEDDDYDGERFEYP